MRKGVWTALAAVGLIAVAVALGVVLVPDYLAERRGDAVDDDVAVQYAKEAIQRAVPQATAFTYGRIRTAQIGDDTVVCGRVDIQEPQDDFNGLERFIYLEDQILLEENEGTDALSDRWRDVCESV